MPRRGEEMPAEQRHKIAAALTRSAPPERKRCPRCTATKPAAEFGLRRANGTTLRSECRSCRSNGAERQARWARRHPEEARLKQRRTDLRIRFGITPEDYDRMLAAQNGCCAICLRAEPGRGARYFCVDHDHETGAIRGLLCHYCNRGLGLLGDNLVTVARAAEYLAAGLKRDTSQRPHRHSTA